jgi:hypothetical protein
VVTGRGKDRCDIEVFGQSAWREGKWKKKKEARRETGSINETSEV